jgi:hypothetical protein
MEREVWLWIVAFVGRITTPPLNRRFTFSEHDILLTFLWASLHDRPISWACQLPNWPVDLRPTRLPSCATMSRRLRQERCARLLEAAHRRLRQGTRRRLLNIVDGKPLPLSNHTCDPDAGYGRGAGGMAKGYKLHAITGTHLDIRTWRVLPMNASEPKTATEMVRQTRLDGYLLGDRVFDDNALHETCRQRGLQLLAERRYGHRAGIGHQRHSPARLHCIEMLEHSQTGFGPTLLAERKHIERFFATFTSAPYGLHALPPWVRRLRRVERYVSAKILIFTIVQRHRKRRR